MSAQRRYFGPFLANGPRTSRLPDWRTIGHSPVYPVSFFGAAPGTHHAPQIGAAELRRRAARVRHDARMVDELLSQGDVRSTNNPVADYSEYLTARAFGLTLVASSSIGYDAIGEDDVRYQVKARRLTARNTSRQLGVEWLQGDRTCA